MEGKYGGRSRKSRMTSVTSRATNWATFLPGKLDRQNETENPFMAFSMRREEVRLLASKMSKSVLNLSQIQIIYRQCNKEMSRKRVIRFRGRVTR